MKEMKFLFKHVQCQKNIVTANVPHSKYLRCNRCTNIRSHNNRNTLCQFQDPGIQEKQRQLFIRQIETAKKLNKPILVHSRDAIQDTFDILREHKVHGLIHCYSGTKEMAREFVKQGYYIALGGAVTFKNSRHAKEVAADIDVNYLLSETDCPYMAPEPVRGTRNDPSNIPYIVDVLAKCRNITVEEMASQIDANWTRFLEGR